MLCFFFFWSNEGVTKSEGESMFEIKVIPGSIWIILELKNKMIELILFISVLIESV